MRAYVRRRNAWLAALGIDVVLDVGANVGQYASEVRGAGYTGHLVSFEPLSTAFEELQHAAERDGNWQCLNVALGSRREEAQLNVSGYSESSSLLPMEERHVSALPLSAYVGRETVSVTTLDAVATEIASAHATLWLKLDVQGYEAEVLNGARETLGRCVGVECELSLVPLYEGQALGHDVMSLLADHGFRAVAVEEAFSDPASQETLQLNAIFLRGSGRDAVRTER